MTTAQPSADTYVLHCDGASRGNPGRASIGFVLSDPQGREVIVHAEVLGEAITNNVAEYTALLRGLDAALAHGVRRLCVRMDSELVVRQVRGEYRVRHAGLQPLHAAVRSRLGHFAHCHLEHVPRRANRRADALANAALDAIGSPGDTRA